MASEWVFTGETYSAESAKAVGLVRGVFAADELLARVRAVAMLISKRAPRAVEAAKRTMRHALAADMSSAQAFEQWSFGRLFDTRDMHEGTAAFVEKREPHFEGG